MSAALPPHGTASTAPLQAARRSLLWLEAGILIALFCAASPLRWMATRGDLWLDEADYAFAAARGFAANRWDVSDVPTQPDRLIRLRHFHPPFTAQVLAFALKFSPEDRILRLPSVIAGGLAVVLIYLCGLSLFQGYRQNGEASGDNASERALAQRFAPTPDAPTRIAAILCALILIATPPHIRASSHAIPWSFIIFWLLALLWTLLKYTETKKTVWLVGGWTALGGLFATSEVFFPAIVGATLALPFLFWPEMKEAESRKRVLRGFALGIVAFLIVVYIFWPAGLLHGGAWTMVRHYMEMADDTWFPVVINGVTYPRAPKWAYLYWYWTQYRPFFLCYTAGLLTALALILRRRLTPGLGITLAFTTLIVFSAHKAHIIGPEYFAHALPYLTLLTGLFFLALIQRYRWMGGVLLLIVVTGALLYAPQISRYLANRALHPRWPHAARFLATRWRPGDRMLAPQYGTVGRWYVLHVGGAPAREWHVQALPARNARDRLVQEVAAGVYRFVAVGSTFSDGKNVDERIWQIIRRWPVIWQSDEAGRGPSRLTIYERPADRE